MNKVLLRMLLGVMGVTAILSFIACSNVVGAENTSIKNSASDRVLVDKSVAKTIKSDSVPDPNGVSTVITAVRTKVAAIDTSKLKVPSSVSIYLNKFQQDKYVLNGVLVVNYTVKGVPTIRGTVTIENGSTVIYSSVGYQDSKFQGTVTDGESLVYDAETGAAIK